MFYCKSDIDEIKFKMHLLDSENVLLKRELVKLKNYFKKYSSQEKSQINKLNKHIWEQEQEICKLNEHLLNINDIFIHTFDEINYKINEITSNLNELLNENTQNMTSKVKLLELRLAIRTKLLNYHKFTSQRYKFKLIDTQNQYKHALMLQEQKIHQLEKQIQLKEAKKPKIIKKIDIVFKKFIQIKCK